MLAGNSNCEAKTEEGREAWANLEVRRYMIFPQIEREPQIFQTRSPFCSFFNNNNSVSFYRRNLPHYQSDYKPHFVTFVTKGRRQLPGWARQIVLDSCIHGHDRKYNLRVALVMPDHAHLILTPLTDSQGLRMFSLHEILQAIKAFSARRINEQLGRRGQVWQRESFDHVLRCSESLDAKIAYVLANQVRAGLVNLPEEYSWKWQKPVAVFHAM